MALRGFPITPNGTLLNITELFDQYTVDNDLSSIIWSVQRNHSAIQIVHLPPVRNVHRVDGMAVVSLTAYVDVYLIITKGCTETLDTFKYSANRSYLRMLWVTLGTAATCYSHKTVERCVPNLYTAAYHCTMVKNRARFAYVSPLM